MNRFKLVALALVGILAFASPVLADNIHIGNTTNNTTNNQGGQGGAGGTGYGGNAYQSQGQGQHQGQHQAQGQIQGQGQGQAQSANNKGNQQNVKFESSMIPGVAVAPGLTSGGSQVCLGSFSVGLSGPMAGVAFGKTVIDKGCEDRQHAILLYNMGYVKEALELLKSGNERVANLFQAPAKVSAAPAPGQPQVSAMMPVRAEEQTNFGQR